MDLLQRCRGRRGRRGGVGSAQSAAPARRNAMWIIDANALKRRPLVRDDFIAWPAKGYVPYSVVYPRWSFA